MKRGTEADSEIRRLRAVEMRENGATMTEIKEALGCSQPMVSYYLNHGRKQFKKNAKGMSNEN